MHNLCKVKGLIENFNQKNRTLESMGLKWGTKTQPKSTTPTNFVWFIVFLNLGQNDMEDKRKVAFGRNFDQGGPNALKSNSSGWGKTLCASTHSNSYFFILIIITTLIELNLNQQYIYIF